MTVRVDRHEGDIAVLTITSPPNNLYDAALHEQFDHALLEVETAPPRALLIRAEGKVVSGGVDVAEFQAQKTLADTKKLYDRMIQLPDRIDALGIPTFFAAHALTLTWAFEVALSCDLILASESAKFGLVERVIGLTPTMGGTQRLAARAGVSRAKEVVFTGALYDATTLESWGVVARVWPDDGFDDAVLNFVRPIATGPTRAFGAAKDVIRRYEAGGVPEANAYTTAIAARLFVTEDLQLGMASFLSSGPGRATFQGR